MIEILTVCTGNVCRSPLAAAMLSTRLGPLGVRVVSSGIAPLAGSPVTPETARLVVLQGGSEADASAHRARRLTASQLETPDLILAMDRTHRRAIVELAPRRLRSTFTIREFARLSSGLPDASIRAAVEASGASDPHDRVRVALAQVTGRRSSVEPPAPDEDDVPDPYRRGWKAYETSGALVASSVDEVARVVRAALG